MPLCSARSAPQHIALLARPSLLTIRPLSAGSLLLSAIHIPGFPIAVPVPIPVAHGRAAPTPRPTSPAPIVPIAPAVPILISIPWFSTSSPVIPHHVVPATAIIAPGIAIVAWDVRVHVGACAAAGTATRGPATISVGISVVTTIGGGRGARREATVAIPGGDSVIPGRGRTAVVAGRGTVAASAVNAVAVVGATVVVGPAANGTASGSRWHGRPTVVELSTIKLVAFFECWEFVGLGRVWWGAEVGMLQRIDGVNALLPVQLEELLQERDSLGTMFPEPIAQISLAGPRAQVLCAWQRAPTRHVVVGRGPAELEDQLKLMTIALSGKNGLASEHLTKDTPESCRVSDQHEQAQG